jgi:hypothetical protein
VFDAVEEAFDEVALATEPARQREALLAVGARGDVSPRILSSSVVDSSVFLARLVTAARDED